MIEFLARTDVRLQGCQPGNRHAVLAALSDCLRRCNPQLCADSPGPHNDGFDPKVCNCVLAEGRNIQHRRRLYCNQRPAKDDDVIEFARRVPPEPLEHPHEI
jgi:hypothetical protein